MRSYFLITIICLMVRVASADVRTDIDEKRKGVDYLDKKGLELSRDFIKQDSNYYVGWMYEACYKYNRAQDRFGYTLAVKSFEKAITKLERDYRQSLRINSNDLMAFIEAYQRQIDYTYMCNGLYTSYLALEQSENAFRLCKKALSYRMMNYFYFSIPYNHIAWIIHRVRTQGKKGHLFLKEDVVENERLALKYCDSTISLVNRNYSSNASLFGDESASNMYLSSHFYKALIYTYLAQCDSAEYFYKKLKGTGYFSNNNYAYLKYVAGDFKSAEEEFLYEKRNYNPSEKRTNEFNYMLSILNIFKGNAREDVDSLASYIQNRGEVPGFGWDNLALARSCYYAGELKKSKQYLKKSADFQELNINVSWAPEQYQYAISLLQYLNSERDLQTAIFNNKNWWYNVPVLIQLPKLYLKKITNRHKLTTDFSLNKEREYAFYQLFNSECLVTFDEIWMTIDGYSVDYFIKKYEAFEKLKNREGVRRYYQYFLARLYYKKGELDKSLAYLDKLLKDPFRGQSKEALLDARVAELKAHIYKDKGDDKNHEFYCNTFYETYPALMLYSGLEKKFKISIEGERPVWLDSLVAELKSANIVIVPIEDQTVQCPVVQLKVGEGKKTVAYEVRSSGIQVVAGKLSLGEQAGLLLAYRLFGVEVEEVDLVGKNDYVLIGGILSMVVILWLIYNYRKRRALS